MSPVPSKADAGQARRRYEMTLAGARQARRTGGPEVTRKFTREICPRCGQPEQVVSGAWLRARRESAGLTLRDVRRRMGLSIAYLSDIERGRRRAVPRVVEFYERLEAQS